MSQGRLLERPRLERRIGKARRRLARGHDLRPERDGDVSETEILRRLEERLSTMNGHRPGEEK